MYWKHVILIDFKNYNFLNLCLFSSIIKSIIHSDLDRYRRINYHAMEIAIPGKTIFHGNIFKTINDIYFIPTSCIFI